jgi:O-antigen/teichoic acid export membrane protein
LIAPEFIRLLLGDKWLPMLETFRLMLLYTLFDPVKVMIGSLLTISGKPERVIRVRLIQLGVLSVGLMTLGPWLGIVGVALAVDVMLVVGVFLLYTEARRFVDFSLRQTYAAPTVALAIALGATYVALRPIGSEASDWLSALVKILAFSVVYVGVLFVIEREQFKRALTLVRQALRGKRLSDAVASA